MANFRHIHGDEDAIWDKSNILSKEVHAHDPFIVLHDTDEADLVDTLGELLTYDDEQAVLWQWKGVKSSNFFELTVGDIREQV